MPGDEVAGCADELVDLLHAIEGVEDMVHLANEQRGVIIVVLAIGEQDLAGGWLRKHHVILGTDGDKKRIVVFRDLGDRIDLEQALEECRLQLDLVAPG